MIMSYYKNYLISNMQEKCCILEWQILWKSGCVIIMIYPMNLNLFIRICKEILIMAVIDQWAEAEGLHPVIFFQYERTRAEYHPVEFPRDHFWGYFTCDSYQAYCSLPERITATGCMVHESCRFETNSLLYSILYDACILLWCCQDYPYWITARLQLFIMVNLRTGRSMRWQGTYLLGLQ